MDWKMAEICEDRRLVIKLAYREDCLDQLCERFAPIVFAVAFKHSERIDDAHTCVEPVLRRLCKRLVQGEFAPEDWESELSRETTSWCDARRQDEPQTEYDNSGTDDSAVGLASFALLPRIVRRRSISNVLAQLELNDLIIVLLRYCQPAVDQASIAAIIGKSESDVSASLVAIDEKLRAALAEAGVER